MSTVMQKFAVSRLKDARFKPGFRTYFQDRDLGVRAATGNRYTAEIHRACAPCPQGGSGAHTHTVDFQFNYVLKGWIKGEYEGAGVVTMREGSCWLQPPRIKHTVLDYSDDCELLEIIIPADFDTVELV